MSSIDQPYASDPGDLFLRLFWDLRLDALDEQLDDWFDDSSTVAFADYVEGEALTRGTFDTNRVREEIEDYPGDVDQRRYSFLLGLDRALAHVHPAVDAADGGNHLLPLSARYRESGRFNLDEELGALLPRFAFRPALTQTDPPDWQEKSDLFLHVTCVGPRNWRQIRSRRVPRIFDLPAVVRLEGLTVASAPVCALDDVVIKPHPRAVRASYMIRPAYSAKLGRRIAQIVRALDESQAEVAVMPELTLGPRELRAWRKALAEPPPQGSRLRLIMAGTGAVVNATSPRRVVNRAVLLSRGGDDLMVQDKRHGFTLMDSQIAGWGLEPMLGAGSRAESLQKRRYLSVLESSMGRICILVCEDLGRTVDDGRLLAEVGPSHLFAPVFSKPTLPHYWEHSDAKKWATAIGAYTVVANSLVIAEAMRRAGCAADDDRHGTALVHSPSGDFDFAAVDDPGDIVLLRLAPEAAVVAEWLTRDD